MPPLALKDNPPSKPFQCSILETQGTWWVAKVKPRQEKALAFDLLHQGIDYYLPFREKTVTRPSNGTSYKYLQVVFASYVPFISEDPYMLLRQNRISTILPVNEQRRFRMELQNVFLANSSGLEIEAMEPGTFRLGDAVEVFAGPLSGVTGNIIDIFKESADVIISVNPLGLLRVRVDAKLIRYI